MKPEKLEFAEISGENSRTYLFPKGAELTVFGVTKICVRPSGTHRLESAGGFKYIVPAGWIGIRIDAGEWSL